MSVQSLIYVTEPFWTVFCHFMSTNAILTPLNEVIHCLAEIWVGEDILPLTEQMESDFNSAKLGFGRTVEVRRVLIT